MNLFAKVLAVYRRGSALGFVLLWLVSAVASGPARSVDDASVGGDRFFESAVAGRARALPKSLNRVTNTRAWWPSAQHRLTPPHWLATPSETGLAGSDQHTGARQLLIAICTRRLADLAFPYDATAPPTLLARA